MKSLFLVMHTFFLLFSCAGSKPAYRADSQKEYEKEEAVNQERSLNRSELITRRKALDLQISAVGAQIATQENLIRRWDQQEEETRSQGMIDNAKVRIRHLKQEQSSLVKERESLVEQLENLSGSK